MCIILNKCIKRALIKEVFKTKIFIQIKAIVTQR